MFHMRTFFSIQALALCLLLLALPACGKRTSDEEAVRGVITAAAEAVEAKDLKTLMGFVSKGFYDDKGNDYRSLKGILFYRFMRPGKLRVFLRGLRVRVEGKKAVADLKVFVVRGMGEEGAKGIIPEDAEGFKVSVVLGKVDGDWKVLNAVWREAGVGALL